MDTHLWLRRAEKDRPRFPESTSTFVSKFTPAGEPHDLTRFPSERNNFSKQANNATFCLRALMNTLYYGDNLKILREYIWDRF